MNDQIVDSLEWVILLPSFLMLVAAVYISFVARVNSMITGYKFQSALLVIVTWLAASTQYRDNKQAFILLFFVGLIPLFLMRLIEPVLARATLIEELGFSERLKQVAHQIIHPRLTKHIREQAVITWLKPVPQQNQPILSIIIEMAMIILSFATTILLEPDELKRAFSLAISFSLLAVGLSVLINKQNIIAQIIGLLVMEHGMFLAAVQVIESSPTTITIAVSLFFYILVTLTILLALLPDLHRLSGTIQVDEQDQLKG